MFLFYNLHQPKNGSSEIFGDFYPNQEVRIFTGDFWRLYPNIYIELKMTRRSRSNNDEEIDCHITLKSNAPVSDYLKNNYFDLLCKTNTKLQCPVCLEDDLLCRENCFCLLNCGHAMHLHEYLKLNKCPVCRK